MSPGKSNSGISGIAPKFSATTDRLFEFCLDDFLSCAIAFGILVLNCLHNAVKSPTMASRSDSSNSWANVKRSSNGCCNSAGIFAIAFSIALLTPGGWKAVFSMFLRRSGSSTCWQETALSMQLVWWIDVNGDEIHFLPEGTRWAQNFPSRCWRLPELFHPS